MRRYTESEAEDAAAVEVPLDAAASNTEGDELADDEEEEEEEEEEEDKVEEDEVEEGEEEEEEEEEESEFQIGAHTSIMFPRMTATSVSPRSSTIDCAVAVNAGVPATEQVDTALMLSFSDTLDSSQHTRPCASTNTRVPYPSTTVDLTRGASVNPVCTEPCLTTVIVVYK